MKIIAVIPARYQSSRFPGKPLAIIGGKPMIWWVYQQVKKVKNLTDVIVATDDNRIAQECQNQNIKFIMTKSEHATSTERLNEVANKVDADLYICINGDEPLIDPNTIEAIIPKNKPDNCPYVANIMTQIKSASEVIDFTNIKVVVNSENEALFMSRSPIPYPKASLDYQYYKHVGVLIYNKEALEYFSSTSKGYNESIEDINELRFIEHGIKIHMITIDAETLSVDTPKDLEKVRQIIQMNQVKIS